MGLAPCAVYDLERSFPPNLSHQLLTELAQAERSEQASHTQRITTGTIPTRRPKTAGRRRANSVTSFSSRPTLVLAIRKVSGSNIRPRSAIFAQIGLCAGAEDLPQLGGFSAFRPSKAPAQRRLSAAEIEKVLGPELPGIRCPKCQWKPRVKVLWSCKCGHRWNTFDTRGLCPECEHQWELTGCLQCGAMSPHLEWYVEK